MTHAHDRANGGIRIRRSRHAQQFVTIANKDARNGTVSFRARGLHHHLLSLPDDWHVTTTMLAQDNPEGRDAIRAALAELERAGYVTASRRQVERGRWRWDMTVEDEPVPVENRTSSLGTRKPKPVTPKTGNPSSALAATTSVSAGQTEDGFPVVGKPGFMKNTDTKNRKNIVVAQTPSEPLVGPPTPAARTSSSGATLTDQDKIDAVTRAALTYYSESIEDEDALRVWAYIVEDRQPSHPYNYILGAFQRANGAHLDSFLSNAGYEDYDDDDRQRIINGEYDNGWQCPRCGHTYTSYGAVGGSMNGSGICEWCVYEIQNPDAQPIINERKQAV